MQRLLFAILLVVACANGTSADSLTDADLAILGGDYAQAAKLLLPQAEKGDPKAQLQLGVIYDEGKGVAQNYEKAVKWYRKAAEQENVWGQYYLGNMYYNGFGVPQDYQEALMWYRKAAKQSYPRALDVLGLMYAQGQGVPRDLVRAHMWYNVAAATPSEDHGKAAREHRASVASRMTAAQIREAQEMARRCQETKFEECN